MEQVERKPQESTADALLRLLKAAQERRLQLFMEHESEQWFCTSSCMEGVIYRVSPLGCSCQGFESFGRCSHWALFLDRQDLRPPTVAELEAAEAEWVRQQSLNARGHVKSTADWRNFLTAKRTFERLLNLAAGFHPSASSASAA